MCGGFLLVLCNFSLELYKIHKFVKLGIEIVYPFVYNVRIAVLWHPYCKKRRQRAFPKGVFSPCIL